MGLGTQGQSWENISEPNSLLKPELSSALSQLLPNPETFYPHRHFIFQYGIPDSSCCLLVVSQESPPSCKHQAVWCSTLSGPRSTVRVSPEGLLFPHVTGGKLVCWWEVERDHVCITCWVVSFLY